MKFVFRIFLLILMLSRAELLFSDNKNYAFAYLSNTLTSLLIRNQTISEPKSSSVSGIHKQVVAQVIASSLFKSHKVTHQLVQEGITWIEPYFLKDDNFEFLQKLPSDRIKGITARASRDLAQVFQAKNIHQIQFSSLDNDQLKVIEPDIIQINNSLANMDFNRVSNLQIEGKDLFLRLFNLVRLKSPVYGLSEINYPAHVLTKNDLDKFSFISTVKDADFYINITYSLLETIERVKSIIKKEIKTLDLVSESSNGLVNYFNKLITMINRFNLNFANKEPLFNNLVKNALGAVSGSRLKSKEEEFNKGLNGLDTGQQNQIKESMKIFAYSPAVKFYTFAGSPLRSLTASGNDLNNALKRAIEELKTSISLADIEKIESWYRNQIYAYAVSQYSKEEELYYSRLFSYVNQEMVKLKEKFKLEPKLYEINIKKLDSFELYKRVIEALKKFRKEHLSKLDKVIAMISQNPYNDEFKKSLLNLNLNKVTSVEDSFIKLVASQLFFKKLISNFTHECLKAIELEPLFKKLNREIPSEDEKINQSLWDYMIQEINDKKTQALDLWDFTNIASLFKQAIEKKLKFPNSVESNETISDILRKGITGRRQDIEEDIDEEEEEWQEND